MDNINIDLLASEDSQLVFSLGEQEQFFFSSLFSILDFIANQKNEEVYSFYKDKINGLNKEQIKEIYKKTFEAILQIFDIIKDKKLEINYFKNENGKIELKTFNTTKINMKELDEKLNYIITRILKIKNI